MTVRSLFALATLEDVKIDRVTSVQIKARAQVSSIQIPSSISTFDMTDSAAAASQPFASGAASVTMTMRKVMVPKKGRRFSCNISRHFI